MDGLKTANMLPLPTSQHWSSVRTDDDIHKTVNEFLQETGHILQGKNWQEGSTEVSRWLGTQIQQEREGWMFKIRMAMQEIETNRRETLKVQGVLHECTNQLRMIVECCNVEDALLQRISREDPKRGLPMYIECLAEILNSLIEDKVQCLQMLTIKDTTGSLALSTALKKYLQRNQTVFEKQQNEARERQETFEVANAKLNSEIQKLKKLIMQKQEDINVLRMQLKGIREIEEVPSPTHHAHVLAQTNITQARDKPRKNERTVSDFTKFVLPSINGMSSPQSPTQSIKAEKRDSSVIHISEDKLNRLRKSARKLENSLQDALTQLDTFRQQSDASKHKENQQPNGKFPPQQSMPHGGYPTLPKRDLRRVQNLAQWKAKFEVSTSDSEDGECGSPEVVKLQLVKGEDAHQRRKISTVPQTSRKDKKSNDFGGFTFRSLVESIDDLKSKNAKPSRGQVSKCLRCKKLFTSSENHKKACSYHPKGKQKTEQYNDKGQLVRVTHIWQCCLNKVDNPGCCFSQHV